MNYDEFLVEMKKLERGEFLRALLLVLFISLSVYNVWRIADDNRDFLQRISSELYLDHANFSNQLGGWHDPSKGYLVVRTKFGYDLRSVDDITKTSFHEIGHFVFDYKLGSSEKRLFCDEFGNVSINGYTEDQWCSEHFARHYADEQMRIYEIGGMREDVWKEEES